MEEADGDEEDYSELLQLVEAGKGEEEDPGLTTATVLRTREHRDSICRALFSVPSVPSQLATLSGVGR